MPRENRDLSAAGRLDLGRDGDFFGGALFTVLTLRHSEGAGMSAFPRFLAMLFFPSVDLRSGLAAAGLAFGLCRGVSILGVLHGHSS